MLTRGRSPAIACLLGALETGERHEQAHRGELPAFLEEPPEVPGQDQQVVRLPPEKLVLRDDGNPGAGRVAAELVGVDLADRTDVLFREAAILEDDVALGRSAEPGQRFSLDPRLMQEIEKLAPRGRGPSRDR